MGYAALNSPLPGLTVTKSGGRCCGMRGLGNLGQDASEFDTTPTDISGDLVDPNVISPVPVIADPIFDYSTLRLAPANISEPLTPIMSPVDTSMLAYPSTIGTEFVSNGDGTYTNIQTGQSVPYSIAQQVTAATAGTATQNVQTVNTEGQVTLTDPNTGVVSTVSTNNLTAAAQALNSAGQLVTAAGKLTAQGQALLNAGNLYNAPPATGISAAMSSLTSWFSGSTMIAGVPNAVILVGGLAALMILPAMLSGGKKRRR